MLVYLALNLCVLLVVCLVAYRHRASYTQKHWLFVLIPMLCLTAIFDSLIVGFNVVGYNDSHILGWYIGKAPVEDFAYSIAATLIIPILWKLYDEK